MIPGTLSALVPAVCPEYPAHTRCWTKYNFKKGCVPGFMPVWHFDYLMKFMDNWIRKPNPWILVTVISFPSFSSFVSWSAQIGDMSSLCFTSTGICPPGAQGLPLWRTESALAELLTQSTAFSRPWSPPSLGHLKGYAQLTSGLPSHHPLCFCPGTRHPQSHRQRHLVSLIPVGRSVLTRDSCLLADRRGF